MRTAGWGTPSLRSLSPSTHCPPGPSSPHPHQLSLGASAAASVRPPSPKRQGWPRNLQSWACINATPQPEGTPIREWPPHPRRIGH